MASSASNSLWYVYGIVRSPSSLSSAPAGLDDSKVALEPAAEADVAALVSTLEGPAYEPASIEVRSGDVDWLSPRAVAHDRVLTWASDGGPVVPLPMFSLFSSRGAVQDMLRDRAAQLTAALARIGESREYALRVYRVDAELLAVIASLSPRLQELATSAASASPGQRYLLERKLDAEKRGEVRAVTQQIVEEIIGNLTPNCHGVARAPIPRVTDAETSRGTMVLNAAFLVPPQQLESFQRALTALVQRRGPQGFRFDFTGPWPPYHFVNEPSDGD